jgi:cell division protein FtsL
MNVAARALARGTLSWEKGLQWKWHMSLRMCGIFLLLFAVLASALSVIYIKSYQCNLYSELQTSQQERDNLKTQWSQLLLEENTWVAPLRIQALAQQALGMQIPQTKTTVVLTQPT